MPGSAADAVPTVGAQIDLSPPVEPASRYVFLSSLLADELCGGGTDTERAIYIAVDQATTMQVHATDNCSYQTTYGALQSLPSLPAHVEIDYATLSGARFRHYSSQVLVLGVR